MACNEQQWEALIAGYDLDLISPEERRALEEHVLECDECFEDLYESSPVAAAFRDRRGAAAEGAASAEPIPAPQPWSRARIWVLAGTAAAVLVVGVLAVTLMSRPEGPVKRGGPEGPAILVYAPQGQVAAPDQLEWGASPEAVSYDVRLYTAAGDLLWEEHLEAPPAALPDAVRELLEPGRSYIWQVEAVSRKGARWKSAVARFTVKN